MNAIAPRQYYTKQLESLNSSLNELLKKRKALAWLRLFSFIASVVALWILSAQSWAIAILAFMLIFGIFIFFVSRDLANGHAIAQHRRLIKINQQEIAHLNFDYTAQPDGLHLKPAQHVYANDLDIFGRASLYQYINRTTSEQGNKLIGDWLLNPATSNEEINQRQSAVKELGEQTNWRQKLQAAGSEHPFTFATEKNILHWLAEPVNFIHSNGWKAIRIIFPLISFTILGLYLADVITQNRFLPLMLLLLVIAYSISKKIMPAYTQLNKISGELETLSASIHCIEDITFRDTYLQKLKTTFVSTEKKASAKIHSLKKILDRLDYRLNPVVHIPLSIFLCWDLQQIFALEKWKEQNKENIAAWFEALATLESLATLGTLSYNHPEWSFPEIATEEGVFTATTLAHPLIPIEKRVPSDYATSGLGNITVITGSNMAGKSTFLRSVGVNIILALAGAPVCATRMQVTPMKVMSSMRISDNLEESTSTFYAELKKLKEIIDAVYKKEKIFLLLDEILRGTNSADRHTGSAALLKQLIAHDAAGMIATHDLELASLVETYPKQIHNYHFDVQVDGEELFFDYKLKEGVCKSMNASILMKKIGIEL